MARPAMSGVAYWCHPGVAGPVAAPTSLTTTRSAAAFTAATATLRDVRASRPARPVRHKPARLTPLHLPADPKACKHLDGHLPLVSAPGMRGA